MRKGRKDRLTDDREKAGFGCSSLSDGEVAASWNLNVFIIYKQAERQDYYRQMNKEAGL